MKKLLGFIVFIISGYLSYLSVTYLDNVFKFFGINFGDVGYEWFNILPGLLFAIGVLLVLKFKPNRIHWFSYFSIVIASILGYMVANRLVFITAFAGKVFWNDYGLLAISVISAVGFFFASLPFMFRKDIRIKVTQVLIGVIIAGAVGFVQGLFYTPTHGGWGPDIPINVVYLFPLWQVAIGLFLSYVLDKNAQSDMNILSEKK